jgi:predicted nucleotidyltransferase component of viral defense system
LAGEEAMEDLIREKMSNLKSAEEKYNFLREFLQELILQILDRHRYFKNLAFMGGTALRLLHDLPRFSEDLDFSLILNKGFDFGEMLNSIEKEMSLAGFEIEISKSIKRTVFSSFIKVKKILHNLNLSRHQNEKLFIKLEIDSNPPKGYKTEIALVNKNFLYKVLGYDLSSLFAGKLHAFLFRKYAKGRDYYDLLWFLTRKVPINYELLNTAAIQTQGKDIRLDLTSIKTRLIKKVQQVDFRHIREELAPFLVNPQELEYITLEYLLGAIGKL